MVILGGGVFLMSEVPLYVGRSCFSIISSGVLAIHAAGIEIRQSSVCIRQSSIADQGFPGASWAGYLLHYPPMLLQYYLP